MPKPTTFDPAVLDRSEIRAALEVVHQSPHSFVELIIDATFQQDFSKIRELIDILATLRAQHAIATSNMKSAKSPSPVEQEYHLSLDRLRVEFARMQRRRATITSRILTDGRQPITLRYNALQTLVADLDNLHHNSKAQPMVRAYLDGEFHLNTFNLLVHAMKEEFLSPEERQAACRAATRMFRKCEPADFGIDAEAGVSRFETDTTEAVFERKFDRLYGDGTYEMLTPMAFV